VNTKESEQNKILYIYPYGSLLAIYAGSLAIWVAAWIQYPGQTTDAASGLTQKCAEISAKQSDNFSLDSFYSRGMCFAKESMRKGKLSLRSRELINFGVEFSITPTAT
jgi:hypothetical protein